MKVTIAEYKGCYHLALTPETMSEVNVLACMQINHKKELRSMSSYPSRSSGIATSIVIGRSKTERYTIK